MVHYINCPVCDSTDIQPCLTVTDFTVTKEAFEIWHCANCAHRFTQDIPAQNEIGSYYKADDYISHTDTRKGLINSLYHMVRKRTLSGKRKLISSITGIKSGSLLDIGCGTGAFLNEMQKDGWKVTGLEPDDLARSKAIALYNLHPKPSDDIFHLPLEQYDAITLWHVLEHVHNLKGYMNQIEKLLKPNGKLFIAVPNYTSSDAHQYKNFWAAYDVPRHLYHFSPESMKHLLHKNRMQLITTRPMWFDSFYVCMLSEQYKGGNIFPAFLNGFISNLKALFNKNKCSSIIYVIEKVKSY